ncbi:COX15/CtaA family protein [Nocardioides sp. Kera G14]|uniref:COX15/CtaA family protein n=1 Tax=Nocardioides sp. Kera G14 TaxID=2884264 RepID=UPI001D122C22|nr:COX15/CtaA family protein [Nocardioides sp. Kera G14]UDY25118.1 COX15/CtaA family protein [Nocardioides sp. Kera G14]
MSTLRRAYVDWCRAHVPALAVANVIANVLIVVSGGIVRLTGSGLGCPTWPECQSGSLVPHGAVDHHKLIEFGNRTLTYVLAAVAISCLVSVWHRDGVVRRLALIIALGIPAQAVLGGVTVLTDLNPWIVACHLLLSMVMVGLCVWLLDDLTGPAHPAASRVTRALSWAVVVVGAVVIWLGTVVTGSGPHAGDQDAKRNGLDPAEVSHIHGYSVWLLVLLTVALLVLAAQRQEGWLAIFTAVLLGIELLQGVLGYVQYALDVPIALVMLHMLGAGLIAAGLARVALTTRDHSPV